MKKVLLIIAFLAGVVSISKAQGPQRRSPEESAKFQLERLPQTLNLSEDQKSKISTIYISQAKSRDSLFTATGPDGDRSAMFSKMTAMTAASDQKVLALLNNDQKKIYTAYMEERAERMRNRQQGN